MLGNFINNVNYCFNLGHLRDNSFKGPKTKNKTNKTAFKPGGGGAGQRRKKDLNSEFEDSLERKGREGGVCMVWGQIIQHC